MTTVAKAPSLDGAFSLVPNDNCEWETPQWLFDLYDQEFHFTLDVCANPSNAKCDKFLTREVDGLASPWIGTCWCNPPYGRETAKWIRKAYEESKKGATVVCLVPNRTETDWFHDYALKGEIRFVRKRIHFSNAGRPRFGSIIVIFRPEVKPTWTGLPDLPDPTPKDFEALTAEYMQTHYPKLWIAIEMLESERSPHQVPHRVGENAAKGKRYGDRRLPVRAEKPLVGH